MKIVYKDNKVEKQCTSLKEAKKLFGGNKALTISFMSRIEAIKSAVVIKDIISMHNFHFHKLNGEWEGFFAIDVKSRRDKWRIILQPLDENENVFNPCNIDEIADRVKIVEIKKVSQHYE
ncbi:MAG: type II toxin-antitoxin system RelE/ParE family toxin [Erysipelotrichaceae bacterium]|nr:type II toxin-antitoxin system RelE/ParE family toxin [Erysipelotrichaceae bacterium]